MMKKLWSTINGKLSISVAVMVILGIAILVSLSTYRMYEVERSRAIESACNVATEISSDIRNEINTATSIAQTFAHNLSINLYSNNKLTRVQVNDMLRISTEKYTNILGLYTLWEPNAFDGLDNEFANTAGHDATGRLIPYWVRHKNGTINLEPIEGYEDEVSNDYIRIPKSTGLLSVIDPYYYPIDGKNELIISCVAPVLSPTGVYKGLTGTDLSVEWIGEMLKNYRNKSYKNNLKATLVASNGTIVASTISDTLTLKSSHQFFNIEVVQALRNESSGSISSKNTLYVYKPIALGNNTWYVILSIPHSYVFKDMYNTLFWNILIGIVITASIILVVFLISNNLTEPINHISAKAKEVSIGKITSQESVSTTTELKHLEQAFSEITDSQKNLTDVCMKVANGDYSQKLELRSEEDELFKVVNQMVDSLKHADEEEKIRSWTSEGLAKFAELLRNVENESVVFDKILSELVKYVGANQGGIYLLKNLNSEATLDLVACYAYNRKKYLNQSIRPGEGLAGQVFLENEPVYLTEIPDNFIRIGSGLGDAKPRALYITTLNNNDKKNGVLELASFSELPEYKRNFINKIAENLSAFVNMREISESTLRLLNESKIQTEMLKAQEEEMRQNMEEMMATQEELSRKSKEVAQLASKSESVMNGLDTAMASAHFDLNQKIIDANKNFLDLMGLTINKAINHYHKDFMPDGYDMAEYETFWNKLIYDGIPFTGIVKRKKTNGEIIWLNSIYIPIKNESGKVVSIMKFAMDETSSKNQESKLSTLHNEMSIREQVFNLTTILSESDLFGNIIYANKKLEEISKYTQEEMIGKPHNLFRHPDMPSKLFEILWKNLKSEKTFTAIIKNKAKDGSHYWVDGVFIPIKNSEGVITKYVGARYPLKNDAMALDLYNKQALKLGLPILNDNKT